MNFFLYVYKDFFSLNEPAVLLLPFMIKLQIEFNKNILSKQKLVMKTIIRCVKRKLELSRQKLGVLRK